MTMKYLISLILLFATSLAHASCTFLGADACAPSYFTKIQGTSNGFHIVFIAGTGRNSSGALVYIRDTFNKPAAEKEAIKLLKAGGRDYCRLHGFDLDAPKLTAIELKPSDIVWQELSMHPVLGLTAVAYSVTGKRWIAPATTKQSAEFLVSYFCVPDELAERRKLLLFNLFKERLNK